MHPGERERGAGEVQHQLHALIGDVEQGLAGEAIETVVGVELLDRAIEHEVQRILARDALGTEGRNRAQEIGGSPHDLAVGGEVVHEDRWPRAVAQVADLHGTELDVHRHRRRAQARARLASPAADAAAQRAIVGQARDDDEEFDVAEHAQVAVHRQHRALAAREAAGEHQPHELAGQAIGQKAGAAVHDAADRALVLRVAAELKGGGDHAASTTRRRASRSRTTPAAVSATRSTRPTLSSTRSAKALVGST